MWRNINYDKANRRKTHTSNRNTIVLKAVFPLNNISHIHVNGRIDANFIIFPLLMEFFKWNRNSHSIFLLLLEFFGLFRSVGVVVLMCTLTFFGLFKFQSKNHNSPGISNKKKKIMEFSLYWLVACNMESIIIGQ